MFPGSQVFYHKLGSLLYSKNNGPTTFLMHDLIGNRNSFGNENKYKLDNGAFVFKLVTTCNTCKQLLNLLRLFHLLWPNNKTIIQLK
jgi:hypothetical protein